MLGVVATLRILRRYKLAGLWITLRINFDPRKTILLRLPGYKEPVYLRRDAKDHLTMVEVFVNEEYNTNHFRRPINPRFIIDLGANVGYATVYFANRFPNAKILAVEAEANNFAQLQKNTKAYPNVEVIHSAVWSKITNLRFVNPNAGSDAFQVIETSETDNALPAITVNQLIDSSGFQNVDLLKVDIEGAEGEVFTHCDWISKIDAIVIELHDWRIRGSSYPFWATVASRKFNFFQIFTTTFIDFIGYEITK